MKEEEAKREEAGLYAEDMDDDDEETQKLLMQAEQIKEKEDLMRMESRLKRVEKPRMSRKLGRKRERTMSRLEGEMSDLGVNIKKKRMSNFHQEQEREQTGNICKYIKTFFKLFRQKNTRWTFTFSQCTLFSSSTRKGYYR